MQSKALFKSVRSEIYSNLLGVKFPQPPWFIFERKMLWTWNLIRMCPYICSFERHWQKIFVQNFLLKSANFSKISNFFLKFVQTLTKYCKLWRNSLKLFYPLFETYFNVFYGYIGLNSKKLRCQHKFWLFLIILLQIWWWNNFWTKYDIRFKLYMLIAMYGVYTKVFSFVKYSSEFCVTDVSKIKKSHYFLWKGM